MQQRTMLIRKIVSLEDLLLPLSKSSIFQKIYFTPVQAYKISGIFQYTQTQNGKSFSTIKTQLTKYYLYRLMYLLFLFQTCGVSSEQANFTILNNLMKFLNEDKNTKLLVAPGLENYGYQTKKQVQKSICECFHKIKKLNSTQAIINVINSDATLRYDISFIIAIYHLARKEGSLQALMIKLGVNHSLITLNTIQINQYKIQLSKKVDYIEFTIQRNSFQTKAKTITSIQTNSFLNEISFEVINNDMYTLKPPFNLQLFEIEYKNQTLSESESNYIKYCSGNPETNFPIQFCNMDQYSQRQQVSILNLQSSPQESEDKFSNFLESEKNEFTYFQFESIPRRQKHSILQNTPRVNNSFKFVKVVNEMYIPHQMTRKYKQKSKNHSLKKQKKIQNAIKNHSMDEKDSLLIINEDTRRSTLLEMRRLINLNVRASISGRLKLQRAQRRDHLQKFKKNSIKERNINDAAECRRKLLQEYLKRTNQKL